MGDAACPIQIIIHSCKIRTPSVSDINSTTSRGPAFGATRANGYIILLTILNRKFMKFFGGVFVTVLCTRVQEGGLEVGSQISRGTSRSEMPRYESDSRDSESYECGTLVGLRSGACETESLHKRFAKGSMPGHKTGFGGLGEARGLGSPKKLIWEDSERLRKMDHFGGPKGWQKNLEFAIYVFIL